MSEPTADEVVEEIEIVEVEDTEEIDGTVADETEPVGDAARPDTELGPHRVFVDDDIVSSVELNDTITTHTLTHVLIRAENLHLCDTLVRVREMRSSSKSVICFVFHHRPHWDSERTQCLLHDWQLLENFFFHPFRCLVTVIKIVTKTLDGVVGGNRNVTSPVFQ